MMYSAMLVFYVASFYLDLVPIRFDLMKIHFDSIISDLYFYCFAGIFLKFKICLNTLLYNQFGFDQ
jgi:hypothetical protein